jgi:hypothetical protein
MAQRQLAVARGRAIARLPVMTRGAEGAGEPGGSPLGAVHAPACTTASLPSPADGPVKREVERVLLSPTL